TTQFIYALAAHLQVTSHVSFVLLFFNDTSPTEIYTLSLHDALPICPGRGREQGGRDRQSRDRARGEIAPRRPYAAPRRRRKRRRSEEHTSELQSRFDLVCRLLLEKKKKK